MRHRSGLALGLVLVGSGTISLALGTFSGFLIVTGQDPMGGGMVRVIGWLVAVATFAMMVAGGILVLRRSQWFPLFVPLALAVQIPIIEGGPLSYAVISFPTVEWQLWPLFGPRVSAEARLAIDFNASERPFALGLNILALVLLVWSDRYFSSATISDAPAA